MEVYKEVYMDTAKSFNLSLDFEGRHYQGTVTPSEDKGVNGMPIFFRILIGNTFFAYLCCGDKGWKERDGISWPGV